jgi:hypothetical protein
MDKHKHSHYCLTQLHPSTRTPRVAQDSTPALEKLSTYAEKDAHTGDYQLHEWEEAIGLMEHSEKGACGRRDWGRI